MTALLALGLGLALVGALVSWWGIRSYRVLGARYDAARNWTKTTAQVAEAAIVDRETSTAESFEQTVHEPHLRYTYTVGGRTFEGRRLALHPRDPFVNLKDAQRWLLAHAPGSTIDLWHDPANPTDSTPSLDPPGRLQAVVMAAIGVALLPLGLYVLSRA